MLPKCGATRKRDGGQCKLIGSANGRCRFHGGRTPAGNDWHKIRWPNGAAPDAELKLLRKVQAQRRAANRRAKRLAKMTTEQRAEYKAWLRAHQPGSAAKRQVARRERKTAAEVAALMAKSREPETSPERVEIRRRVAEVKATFDALKARLTASEPDDPQNDDDLGVLG